VQQAESGHDLLQGTITAVVKEGVCNNTKTSKCFRQDSKSLSPEYKSHAMT